MAGSLNSVAPVSFESVSNVTLTPSVQLGTVRNDSGVNYVYVYNDGNSQISQGLMGFLAGTSSLSSGYSVTVTNAASQSGGIKAVGVAHNATLTTGSYGWLATKGLVLAGLDASAVSMNAGDIVVPGVDGGFVVYAGTSATGIQLGVAINSIVTTVGTGKIYFRSPVFG